jgi:hypothetical protein
MPCVPLVMAAYISLVWARWITRGTMYANSIRMSMTCFHATSARRRKREQAVSRTRTLSGQGLRRSDCRLCALSHDLHRSGS